MNNVNFMKKKMIYLIVYKSELSHVNQSDRLFQIDLLTSIWLTPVINIYRAAKNKEKRIVCSDEIELSDAITAIIKLGRRS